MEKISFLDVTLTSWRLSAARRAFWLFGFFMALPLAAQVFLLPPAETTSTDQWSAAFALHPRLTLLFLVGYFFLTVFGKSNLIAALERERRSAQGSAALSLPLSQAFSRGLLLDGGIGLFLVLIFAVLSLPALIAFHTSGSVPEMLLILGLLAGAPVAIVLFFVREFSYFYFLLSPLRLKGAVEAGTNFFLRRHILCLWFGLFSLLLTFLFTFFLNLAMLATVALFGRLAPALPDTVVIFAGSLLCFAWYAIFHQSLWFTFFQRLAAPKDKGEAVKTTEALLEEKTSEIPSV